MNKKLMLSILAGLVISGLGLFLAFRNVPFSELFEYVVSINYLWVLPTFLILFASLALRAVRWQIILTPAKNIGFWPAFHPMMISFLINCVLPGRVGEIARPALLKKDQGIKFSTGLATVAVERAFDMLTLITLFAILFSRIEIDPELSIPFGEYRLNRDTLTGLFSWMIKLCALFIIGIIMVNIRYTRDLIIRGLGFVPRLVPPGAERIRSFMQIKLIEPLIDFIGHFATGFSMINQPSKLLFCLLLSAIIWLTGGLSYYVFALGCPGVALSFWEFTSMMVIICFFIALPSVPGFWGLWEAGGVFALLLFGIPLNFATGYTLANHAIQIFSVIIIGFISAMITGVNILKLSYDK